MPDPNPYSAPTAEVRDVVADGQAPHADRGARLGAAFVDGLLAALLFVPALLTIGLDRLATGGAYDFANWPAKALVFGCAGLVILVGVNWYLVARNGQTIGKKLVNIKVVRADSSRATVARIFWLRNVPFWIVSFIPIVGNVLTLVDSLFIFRASRQTLHDQLADTIVIKA